MKIKGKITIILIISMLILSVFNLNIAKADDVTVEDIKGKMYQT